MLHLCYANYVLCFSGPRGTYLLTHCCYCCYFPAATYCVNFSSLFMLTRKAGNGWSSAPVSPQGCVVSYRRERSLVFYLMLDHFVSFSCLPYYILVLMILTAALYRRRRHHPFLWWVPSLIVECIVIVLVRF